jgi:DNA-binding MarR family transcriptional regulator
MTKSVWKHSPSGRTVRRKKSRQSPFVMMPKYLLKSAAWWSLSGAAMAAYLELGRRYTGTNNGQLHLSARELSELYNCSKDTAARALRELVEKGFIEIVQLSGFNLKDRRRQATEYRLTLYACDVSHKLPSKAFMSWRPDPPETPNREAAE